MSHHLHDQVELGCRILGFLRRLDEPEDELVQMLMVRVDQHLDGLMAEIAAGVPPEEGSA